MIHISRRMFVLLLCTAAACSPAQTADPTYRQALAHWREQRAAGLATPDGWLSLVALEWLKPGDTTVGSAPANTVHLAHGPAYLVTLRQQGGHITVTAHDPSLRLDNVPVEDGAAIPPDTSELRSGDLRLLVIERGDRLYLRVKDAAAPTRVHFRGLRWYPPNPHLRITARWTPSSAGHTLTVPNVLGQISEERSPGIAEFTLRGQTFRLEPIQESPDALFFIFRDATSHTTTYGAGRFLVTPLPSHGLASPGTVDLDFNHAVNPPCAYTPYATCPLPPTGNRLSIPIPAGEQRYLP